MAAERAASWRREPHRLAVAAAIVGVGASVITWLVAVVLTFTYRPAGPEWFHYAPGPPPGSGATEGWLVLHTSAAAIAGMGAFGAFLILVWPTGSSGRRVGRWPVVATGLATLAAAVAIVTRDMVTYEQVAFGSVRVVEDLAGYWTAAFDSDVRFVIVDGAEVSPAAYRLRWLAHLVAPLVTAGALATFLPKRRTGSSS